MHPRRLSSFLAPIRLRYLLSVTAILGLVFFSLAYMGMHQARKSLLKIMIDDGKALMTSLTLSSSNAIQAGLLLQSLSEEKFSDLAQAASLRLSHTSGPAEYQRFGEENGLLSIDRLNNNLEVVGSDRWVDSIKPHYPPEVAAEIRDLQAMGGRYRSVLVQRDTLRPLIQYFIYGLSPDGDLFVMAAEAAYIDQITRQIGIGYLIRNISQQSGIQYIVLQSREGIVFSSRSLPPMLAIASDPFLDSLMQTDTTGWRIRSFHRKDLLEIARRFESVTYPPGIYRIGIDLDEYREISRGYDGQIIATAIILFLLTLLVVAVVSINQNYSMLDQSFQRMRTLTETIFDRLSSAVLAFDAQGKVVAVNKALTALTGIDTACIGHPAADLADKIPLEILRQVPSGEHWISMEQKIVSPAGEPKEVLLGISSLPSEAGGGTVVIIHDISEQKRLERENHRRERLSEMGDMAAGVAHEIRNPLNAISIAAQRLKVEFQPSVEKEDYDRLTKNILEESSRLNQILTRFLELAKTRATEEWPIDLDEPVSKAVAGMAAEAEAGKVMIRYDRHQPTTVRANPEKLQQVFVNLIKNSIQAMPEGGEVSIGVDATADKTVTVAIADSGPGFAPEVLSRMFQPYFTTRVDGSGLGLALAYKMITDMGGEISATNRPEGGAVISIVLSKM